LEEFISHTASAIHKIKPNTWTKMSLDQQENSYYSKPSTYVSLTYITMPQVACPQNSFIKPGTQIHMYDAKDVFKLLNSLIRRSSHSTILSKFGSKKSFNLNPRGVPWQSCSWLWGLDSVKIASRCSMTLIWTTSSNNLTGNYYDMCLLWDSEGKEEVFFLLYHSAWVLRVTVRDSFATSVFGDDDPDALPKVPEDPTLNCHLFVTFHTFAKQIFCKYIYIFYSGQKRFPGTTLPIIVLCLWEYLPWLTLSQVTPPALEPVLWGITVIKSKLQVNPGHTACRLTSQDLHLGTSRHVVTFTPLLCLLCLY
jgi:hypothetical protein